MFGCCGESGLLLQKRSKKSKGAVDEDLPSCAMHFHGTVFLSGLFCSQAAGPCRRLDLYGQAGGQPLEPDRTVPSGYFPSVSLPRDRFWDIQVSKIDSPTRQPLLPRPSCVRAASPHLRKLGAGYAALPQMTGRDFSYAYFVSPLHYRTPDKQYGPGRYRGLTAFASLSMAVSDG